MKDPVCGMEIKEDSKFKSDYNSRTYLFCSASCKQNFDKKPENYAKNGAASKGGCC